MRESKETYRLKLLDPRWQRKRLKILERDGWKCIDCDAAEKTLHVHHSYYREDAEGPWDYEDHTLLTLCADCHETETYNLRAYRHNTPKNLAKVGFVRAAQIADMLCAFGFSSQPFSQEEIDLITESIRRVSASLRGPPQK